METEMWIAWAVKHPGPAGKVFPERNRNDGLVLHSVEGWLAGAFGELDKPDRQASWHFTIALDGTLYQHYDTAASCWASGNREANTRYLAVESEGTNAADLTTAQVATLRRLIAELGFHRAQLYRHRDVATKWQPNSGGTACPSGRYEAALREIEAAEQEDEMTEDQVRAIFRQEIAEWEQKAGAAYEPFVKGVSGRLDGLHDALKGARDYPAFREGALHVLDLWQDAPAVDPN